MFVERMDDEFTKILLNTDAHSTLYVERYGYHSYCVSGSCDWQVTR